MKLETDDKFRARVTQYLAARSIHSFELPSITGERLDAVAHLYGLKRYEWPEAKRGLAPLAEDIARRVADHINASGGVATATGGTLTVARDGAETRADCNGSVWHRLAFSNEQVAIMNERLASRGMLLERAEMSEFTNSWWLTLSGAGSSMFVILRSDRVNGLSWEEICDLVALDADSRVRGVALAQARSALKERLKPFRRCRWVPDDAKLEVTDDGRVIQHGEFCACGGAVNVEDAKRHAWRCLRREFSIIRKAPKFKSADAMRIAGESVRTFCSVLQQIVGGNFWFAPKLHAAALKTEFRKDDGTRECGPVVAECECWMCERNGKIDRAQEDSSRIQMAAIGQAAPIFGEDVAVMILVRSLLTEQIKAGGYDALDDLRRCVDRVKLQLELVKWTERGLGMVATLGDGFCLAKGDRSCSVSAKEFVRVEKTGTPVRVPKAAGLSLAALKAFKMRAHEFHDLYTGDWGDEFAVTKGDRS